MTRAGIIAALYVVFTYIARLAGLDSGAIQIRISEALCILPSFTAAAIPGLFLGCFLANLLTGAIVLDIIFGSLATLIGALGGYALRKHPLFVPLPTVISNTIIVPLILAYGYRLEDFVQFMMLTVGAGEILSAYVLGIVLYYALKNYRNRLFG